MRKTTKCSVCKEQAVIGKRRCINHLNAHSEAVRKCVQNRIENGMCYRCAKMKVPLDRIICEDCKQKEAERARYYYETKRKSQLRDLKLEVFRAYGMVCACCGYNDWRFLTLDHVNNDGAEHRRTELKGKSGNYILFWIKENDFPDSIQLLCWNCNQGKRVTGVCLHKYDEIDLP